MPEKKTPDTPEDQSKRFVEDAQRLIDAGELSPIDGIGRMDKAIRRASKTSE